MRLAEHLPANPAAQVIVFFHSQKSQKSTGQYLLYIFNMPFAGAVHTVRLDEHLPATPAALVMKIDIEGYEPLVMSGAGNVIRNRVWHAVSEVNQLELAAHGSSAREYVQSWVDSGFEITESVSGRAGLDADAVSKIVGTDKNDFYLRNRAKPTLRRRTHARALR